MAYTRPVKPGFGLKQQPTTTVAGVQETALDAEVATTTSLGIVQIGSGLAITPAGILSATGGDDDCCSVDVKLTNSSYTAKKDDCYIGATTSNITITLPAGVTGKVYYVKNQSNGNVKVQGSGGQTIDGAAFKTLGSNNSIMAVFDGARWNVL